MAEASIATPGDERPAGYPFEWEADVLGSDGRPVRIRPIIPSDQGELARFHTGLSERTRYLRYFGSHDKLSEKELHHITHVDYRGRMSFVVELAGTILAVALYEQLPTDPRHAEVAFTVSDNHQGRGLGSILLEHLAAAASENGIERFEAEVLTENRQMISVFRRAGYEVSRSFDGTSMHLEFDIDPSEALTAVRNRRESAAEARSVARVLTPCSVAVIGASDDPSKIGCTVLKNIVAGGFQGPVYPVNSEARSVGSIRSYANVRDIPDPVDLAVVAVPASSMNEVMNDCLSKEVTTLVIISAGFSDAGGQGVVSERNIVHAARSHGMRVVGPNALGVISTNPEVSLNATLAQTVPRRGRTGFFCQSGALGIAILDTAARRGVGLSNFVSAGNRADVSGNDLLQYWENDDDTEVILLYLESFGNPQKFSRIVRRVAMKKPIVVVRRVSTEPEAKSKGLSAGAMDRLFDDAGLIQVSSISELFDTAMLLSHQPLPNGPQLAIVSNSTAVAVLAKDAALSSGLSVSVLTELGARASAAEFGDGLNRALQREDVNAVLVLFVPPVAVDVDSYADAIRNAASNSAVPVVCTFTAVEGIPEGLGIVDPDGGLCRGSIPSYAFPERAVYALAKAWRYNRWLHRNPGSVPSCTDTFRSRARDIVEAALTSYPQGSNFALTAGQVRELLSCYGVTIQAYRSVSDCEQARWAAEEIGFPVAVKAMGESWRRRNDLSGVRLDILTAAAVERAYDDMFELTGGRSPIHIQKMAPKGIPTTIWIGDHPVFGSVISFGMSGVLSQLLDDRSFHALPLSDVEAYELISRPRAAPLLQGYAGDVPVDRAALVDVILRLATMVEENPEIRSLSIDPALAGPVGTFVLHAFVDVGQRPSRDDAGPRRLR